MSNDRLSELRDLINHTNHELDQLRQEQLELLPALRGSKASTTAITAAFGISRAAFYKNGYDKVGADNTIEGNPAQRDELLDRVRELGQARTEAAEKLGPWRQERDALIVAELNAPEKPKWVELAERAGVSQQWISQVRSGK
jgi:uncharacterized coiled-coil DUF342 family protein